MIMPSDVRKVFEHLNKGIVSSKFTLLLRFENVLMMGWITMIKLYKLR